MMLGCHTCRFCCVNRPSEVVVYRRDPEAKRLSEQGLAAGCMLMRAVDCIRTFDWFVATLITEVAITVALASNFCYVVGTPAS